MGGGASTHGHAPGSMIVHSSSRRRCSSKHITVVMCVVNVVAILVVLQTLLSPLFKRSQSHVSHESYNPNRLHIPPDWAGDINDRKSTSGYVFFLDSSSITWSSKKMQALALSTTEAEYRTLVEANKEALWLKSLLNEIGAEEQQKYIKEAEEIRRAMEPVDLIERVKQIQQELQSEVEIQGRKEALQQKQATELSKRLKDLQASSDQSSQKALEEWRKRKLERAKKREPTNLDTNV